MHIAGLTLVRLLIQCNTSLCDCIQMLKDTDLQQPQKP